MSSRYAAVDLGSNSFHMIIARLEHGELRVIDRVREMVRLAEGVDKKGRLDEDVRERALDCLSRFRQLLESLPDQNVRAVATQSFRKLKHPGKFLQTVESTLGYPVEIIGGREEARLVYQGVAANSSLSQQNRLIVDIGGGSTEFAIGNGNTLLQAESLQYGCVVATANYFSDGRLNKRNFKKAINAVRRDLLDIIRPLEQEGFERSIGTSGTNRALLSIAQALGYTDHVLTAEALKQIYKLMRKFEHINVLDIPGLSERRRPVIAGGLAILMAVFESLPIESMQVSRAALREGLLDNMLDRLSSKDPRVGTIKAFAIRNNIENAQAQRVQRCTEQLLRQVSSVWSLNAVQQQLLLWAAYVHEAGLSIAHSSYQHHTAYMLENSDMPGFSQLDQRFMTTLARYHRRHIGAEWHDGLPERLHQNAAWALALLRLSVIFNRSRETLELDQITLASTTSQSVILDLPAEWIQQHPLTRQDLLSEQKQWSTLGLQLHIPGIDITDD